MLQQALQEVPQLADELEAELTFSLQAYAEELTGTGQGSNALWLYSKVTSVNHPINVSAQMLPVMSFGGQVSREM